MLVFLLYQPILDLHGTTLVALGASQWSSSADGRIFDFQLRPEVRFSNGRPVVSRDYVFTLQRYADPTIASPLQAYVSGIRGFADFVAGRTNRLVGLSAPSPVSLRIELERSDPVFPYVLALMVGFALPEEEAAPGPSPFRTRPAGNGPYRLLEWRRGTHLAFVPNPHYAGPLTHRFDRIEVAVGGDEATHLMMFEAGGVDIANIMGNGIPISDLRRLSHDPKWGPLIEVMPGINTAFIELNTELPPLNDRRVRQALNYAVDKPRRLMASSRQFIPAGGPVPPSMPGHDSSLRGYPFDPAKARELLAETGLSLPLRMTLWLPNDQISRLIGEGIQADLHEVGVAIELKVVSNAEMMVDRAWHRAHRHMAFFTWNPTPDPRDIIGTMFDGRNLDDPQAFNGSFYNNPQVNRLIEQAGTTVDPPQRLGLLRQAERIILEDSPWIFLGYKNLFLLRQPWVKGPILEPFGFYRLDRAWRE